MEAEDWFDAIGPREFLGLFDGRPLREIAAEECGAAFLAGYTFSRSDMQGALLGILENYACSSAYGQEIKEEARELHSLYE